MTDAAALALAAVTLAVGLGACAWDARRRGLTVREWWASLR